jgi:hypothetical protein
VEIVEKRVQNGTKVVEKRAFLLLLRVIRRRNVREFPERCKKRRLHLCEQFKLV